MKMTKREKMLRVRMSDVEWQKLAELSAQAGRTMSDYVRERALSADDEIAKLRAEIIKVQDMMVASWAPRA